MRLLAQLLLVFSLVSAAWSADIAQLNVPQPFSYAGAPVDLTFNAVEGRGYCVVLACQNCTTGKSVNFTVLDGTVTIGASHTGFSGDTSTWPESAGAGVNLYANVHGNSPAGMMKQYRVSISSSYPASTTATGTIAVYDAWDTAGTYDDDRAVWMSPLTAVALDNRTDVLTTAAPYLYYRVRGTVGQTLNVTVTAAPGAIGAHLSLYAMDQGSKLRTSLSYLKQTSMVGGASASASMTYAFPSAGWYYVRLEPNYSVTVNSTYTVTTNTPPDGGGDYSRVDQSDPFVSEGTGSVQLSRNLLTVRGALAVPFSVSYDSQLAQATPVGALGRGWSHPYMVRLVDSGYGTAVVQWDPARRNAFSDRGTGAYRSAEPAVRRDTLTKTGSAWTLTRADQSAYVFDSTGALTGIRNGRGQSLSVTKDASLGWPTKVTDAASNRSIVIRYLGNGKIYQVENGLATPTLVKFAYSGDDLTKITDARGNDTNYAYDGSGRATAASDSLGPIFSASYGGDGRVAWVQDAKGKRTQYAYLDTTVTDLLGSGVPIEATAVSVTDRLGFTRTVTRDKFWRLLSYKDQLGYTVRTAAYGADGFVRRAVNAWGVTTDFTVDANGNVTKAVETPAGGGATMSWSATYDGANNRLSYTDRAGKTWTWTYEGNKVKTATDPLGNVATNAFNADGLLATSRRPGGGTTSFSYQSGQVVSTTDPAGDVTNDEYDGSGRHVAHVDARGKRWEFAYDANDNPVRDTDPLGKGTVRAFDARDRRTSVTDRRGKTSRTEYDLNGNVTADVTATGQRTERAYDDEDRPLTVKRPGGGTASWVRDARGLATETHDELGNVTKASYNNAAGATDQRWDAKGVRVLVALFDAWGRGWKSTDAKGRVTTVEFDAEDRPVATVDNKGRRTELSLDALGRTASVKDALGGTALQRFSADGDLSGFTDPNGYATSLARDPAGRIVSEVSAAGGSGTAYAYYGGLISRVTNARGQAADRSYDNAGRSLGFTDPAGTVALTLDEEGHPLTTAEGGRSVVRTVDDDGRLTSVTAPEGTIAFGYGTDGLLKTVGFDGVTVTYSRGAGGAVTTAKDWANRTWTLAWDQNRRLSLITHPNGVTEARTYDDAGALASIAVTGPGGAAVWSCAVVRDAVGKTSSETPVPAQLPPPGSGTAAMTYGADNRLAAFNGDAVSHDADGNLLSAPVPGGRLESITVDARNRVTSFGGASYAYGAENERIAVTAGGTTVRYLVNLDADLSQVLVADAGTAGKTRYLHIPGVGLVAEDGPAGLRCYHADARGSTVALTGSSGAVAARFAYGPYGEDWGRPEGAASTPFRFGGRDGAMTDANGLVYLRARYYSPILRRFVSRDPVRGGIEDPRTFNAYAYANGDPVDMTDPLGTSSIMTQFAGRIGSWMKDRAMSGADAVRQAASGALADWEYGANYYMSHPDEYASDVAELASNFPIVGAPVSGGQAIVAAYNGDWAGAAAKAADAFPGVKQVKKLEKGVELAADAKQLYQAEKRLVQAEKSVSAGAKNSAIRKNASARNASPGDSVRTPTTHPDDFSKNSSGQYRNRNTGEIWEKSHTNHNADVEWKVGTSRGQSPTKGNKVTVAGDGTVIKIDQ